MSLLAFVLAACATLAPGRDHTVLATAIASTVEREGALFLDDVDKRRTAAWVIAVAYREGSLQLGIVGDHGQSFCTMQIHRTAGGTPAMLTDANLCVGRGFELLRTSIRICPKHPTAWYAEGPNGCASPRAKRISNDRMWLAKKLVRETVVLTDEHAALFFGHVFAICPRHSHLESGAGS